MLSHVSYSVRRSGSNSCHKSTSHFRTESCLGDDWWFWWCVFFLPPNIWSNAPPKTNMTMEHHHFLNRRYEIRLQVVCFPASHISFLRCTSQFWLGHICSIVFFLTKCHQKNGRFKVIYQQNPFFLPKKWLSMLPGGDKMSFLFFLTKTNLESNLHKHPWFQNFQRIIHPYIRSMF